MLGHDSAGASLTRVADVSDYHITFTLRPWAKRWESAIAFSLLADDEYCDFREADFYRMDLATRAQWGATALGSGGGQPFATLNEVREVNGFEPLPDGDDLKRNDGSDVLNEVENALGEN